MESPLSVFFRMHWDHEPETRKPFRIKASVFRFMESIIQMTASQGPRQARFREIAQSNHFADDAGSRFAAA